MTSRWLFQSQPPCPPWADAVEKRNPLSGFPERETARSEAGPRPGTPAQTKILGPNESPAPLTALPAHLPAAARNAAPPQAGNRRPGIKTISPPAQRPAFATRNLPQNLKTRQVAYFP